MEESSEYKIEKPEQIAIPKKISRRKFLKVGGGIVAASLLGNWNK